MAFGTGHHETTRSCLELIERLSAGSQRKSLLDVGTGTGILAIGASKLGFEFVTGVDTDPAAVDAARKNVEMNCPGNVTIKQGDIADIEGQFDLITANIVSEVLIKIADKIVSRLNPGGIAVLSGIMGSQDDDVVTAVENAGLTLREKAVDVQWITLVFDTMQGRGPLAL